MRKRGDNEFDVLEVDMGHPTPCHIPISRYGRPFATSVEGYSRIPRTRPGGRVYVLAHRVRYEAKHGPIPAGMVPDHLCRNRACCNPDHIEAVTNAENVRRGACAKLNPAKVLAIRAMRAAGIPCKEIAIRFGVSPSVVSRTSRGENWTVGPTPAWGRVKARRAEARVEC